MAGNDVFLRSVPPDADRNDVRLYDPTTADSAGGTIIGTAAQTLGAVTQSAPGQLLIKGTASATLGSFTQAATGKVLVNATETYDTGSSALTAFSEVYRSVGKRVVETPTPMEMGYIDATQTGTVSSSGVAGLANQTLDAFTQSAPATVSQPVVVTPPTQSTGGALGGMAWYDRKYRKQIRATIESVLRELNSTDDRRKKKRILRKAKAKVVEAVNFEAPRVPQILAPLEEVRLQLLQATLELAPIEEQLVKLMNDYKTNLRSIERNEEEAILAILLLAA